MMKKFNLRKLFLVLIVASVFISSLGLLGSHPGKSNPQAGEKKVAFKLEKTFGAESKPKEALLSSVSSVEVDGQGNLYIKDKGDRILSFKPDGSLRWVLDKKGKGPGDISDLNGFTTDGEKYLYLSNIRGNRIDKFDLKGKYLNSKNVSELHLTGLSILGFIKPNLLVVEQTTWGKIGGEVIVLEVNKDYKIKSRFIVDISGNLKLPQGVSLGVDMCVTGDYISVGNTNEYKLTLYDITGKCIKTIKKNQGSIITAYTMERGGGEAGGIGAPIRIGKSYYLCSASYPVGISSMQELASHKGELEFRNLLDIFDDRGNLIYSKQVKGFSDEELGRILMVDSNGYLYTTKAFPYPQVCKYKVIIENKK